MGSVRPFKEDDIPEVAELHRKVFHTGDSLSLELQRDYQSYFTRIFLRHPWREQGIASLVYEDDEGGIAGFLGVVPRLMSFNGRPIRAAVSSQFIVDPNRRSTLAAIKLLKAFISGPQDLSIADEANDASRKLLESLGGSAALLYSLYWFRLLQPTQFLLSRVSHPVPRAFSHLLAPVGRLIDAVSVRLPQSPVRRSEPSVIGEDLSAADLLACLAQLSGRCALRPEYNERSLEWLLTALARDRGYGELQKVAVRKHGGNILGWYIYVVAPNGLGEILQIGAELNSIKMILDHLFDHAVRHGAFALSGRYEPQFVQQLHEKHSMFHHRGHWVLIHSNDPKTLNAIHRGNAFLSRLEGEWIMRFRLASDGYWSPRQRLRISYQEVPPVPLDVARSAP
ncbi:MAG TPA: hypothetical protein VL754_22265 [Verrucomicrobiae bacterium]|nr:hypothetical protein [Verrucomicrobiae bacterium]